MRILFFFHEINNNNNNDDESEALRGFNGLPYFLIY